jgi:octaheme c-type cytochrome (tetrathionate reductase family)
MFLLVLSVPACSEPQALTENRHTAPPPAASTADHAEFGDLQQEFETGPQVTAACLTCHTEAAKQIMKTSHWTWICPRAKRQLEEQQHIAVGKAEHIINNFCIALPSNEPRCTSCHAGYGWKDKTFDFGDETLVDCLVCHDQTGTYKKFPTAAGHPVYAKDYPAGREWPKGSGNLWPPVDLRHVAQHVGRPTRRNCGTCHFFGGGGEGVKHGDMDVTLTEPDRTLDVHMAVDGPDFRCTQCHTTREHVVSGRCFTVAAYESREFVLRGLETNLLACEACHTTDPHPDHPKLNDHADKVSCQACHIPTLARRKPTKMWWDWSKAGQMNENGKPFGRREDPTGELSYHTQKGEFIWAKDAVPEYVWFNGSMKHTFFGDPVDDQTPAREKCEHPHGRFDKIDENQPVVYINRTHTSYDDPKARIWPAKVHRGLQPYDPVNKTLVIPKLFPCGPDAEEAYWKSYDWARAIQAGMSYAGLPYSGQYDWIQTEMIWPLKHMVAPKENALSCVDCHQRPGRMADLTGFYMPGRDRSALLDRIGFWLIVASVAAAAIHGSLRIALRPRGGRR